jgi:hypothetical protein
LPPPELPDGSLVDDDPSVDLPRVGDIDALLFDLDKPLLLPRSAVNSLQQTANATKWRARGRLIVEMNAALASVVSYFFWLTNQNQFDLQ